MQIINIYAPTSNADDEDIEHFVVVTGDFNARIGKKKQDDKKIHWKLWSR